MAKTMRDALKIAGFRSIEKVPSKCNYGDKLRTVKSFWDACDNFYPKFGLRSEFKGEKICSKCICFEESYEREI